MWSDSRQKDIKRWRYLLSSKQKGDAFFLIYIMTYDDTIQAAAIRQRITITRQRVFLFFGLLTDDDFDDSTMGYQERGE